MYLAVPSSRSCTYPPSRTTEHAHGMPQLHLRKAAMIAGRWAAASLLLACSWLLWAHPALCAHQQGRAPSQQEPRLRLAGEPGRSHFLPLQVRHGLHRARGLLRNGTLNVHGAVKEG